ncbi:MAG TPA: glutamate racemase [Flavobacteriales bacterium]|nr:glutamate racemase [Flavobacteriales bacterium]HMR28334.1 glutamate racemase [Flavobacteriales bacterium]
MRDERPIGVFDSGIGGLTVAVAIRQALPAERLLYFGDQAHVPYGDRDDVEILAFSEGIAHWLLGRGAKALVIACNTASAAALKPLRERLPQVPIVGMEPAVKPAVEHTRTGVVGVIATVATMQGGVFASIVERFAQGVTVLQQACPGLVRQIEAGELDTPRTEAMLRGWLSPMLDRGIDALVLGCTHYPLVRPVIERIVGPAVRVIDPAPAIARRLAQVLADGGLEAGPGEGGIAVYTSGDVARLRDMLQRLGMVPWPVQGLTWDGGRLTPP